MSRSAVGQEGVKWAREEIGKFLTEELKHFDVRREVLEGDAGHQIVAAARHSGADLIMMPTHGLSVFRRYILGSITAKVLHDAECAVWTGTHMEEAPPLDAIAFPKVLCAIDRGTQSERALRWAAGFAKEHSAELIVTNIIAAWADGQARYFDQGIITDIAKSARQEVQALLNTLGITARLIVVGGEPAKAISEIAHSERVSQVVIARGAVAEGFGRLRSQGYAIIRSSPCPVVSV
jgi:nucleotide-binding universal stress UspA family protein